MHRFLLVPPANFQDAQVLERVVKFVTMLIAATPDANEEHADILWPVVVEAMNANVLPLLMGDHTMDLPTKSTAGDTFNLGDIQNAHLGFVCTLAQKLPCSHVTRLLRETPVMDVIKTVTVKCFSSPQVTVQDRENRIRCLRVILQLVSMPSLVDVVDGQTIGDFIAVLTQTLGCLQQNFANIDTFSHQDRTVYRLLALSLRHISRTASELALAPAGGKNKIRANWIWGDHWLFEGALDWLLTLLSDDDIRMQRIALGIIGNFLLVPESYRSIMGRR